MTKTFAGLAPHIGMLFLLQTCPYVLRLPLVAFILFLTWHHVPRSKMIAFLFLRQPPLLTFLSVNDSQPVSVDPLSADIYQSSLVTSHLSAQAEPFYPPTVDKTHSSTTQHDLFTTTHTLEVESADVDQTLVKSAPDDELPEHVNLLFIQTTTEQSLPPDIVDGLKQLLHDHTNTFAKSSADLGFCDILQHDIDTGDSPPIKQPPRRPPLAASAAEDEILEEMLSTGVIEPSHSPWASPVCLVRKKEGTYRFCVDYRPVNARTHSQSQISMML